VVGDDTPGHKNKSAGTPTGCQNLFISGHSLAGATEYLQTHSAILNEIKQLDIAPP